MKGMKKIKDERINKERNHISAKLYYLIITLLIVSIALKIYYKKPIEAYLLDGICLVVGLLYVVINKARKGILVIKQKDEILIGMNEEILAKGFGLCFQILIFGELIPIYLGVKNCSWYAAIWGIPALILLICSVKHGLLIWGGSKRQSEGKKQMRKSVIIGTIIFGLLNCNTILFHNGTFHPERIGILVGTTLSWGLLFYFAFCGIVDYTEKQSNKDLDKNE